MWSQNVESNQLAHRVSLEQPNAFEDKPLTELAREGNTHMYRFYCFTSFGPDLSVRLQINKTGSGIIFLKQLDYRYPTNIRTQPQYDVDPTKVSQFLTLLESMDYWNIPTRESTPPGFDGSTWLLEGLRNSSFHAVSRWSPESGVFREAALLLLNYAGLDACETFGLLGQYALHKLEYVGFLSSDDPVPIKAGFVKTPDGLVERVMIGEGMGAHHGLVHEIAEDYIEIDEIFLDRQGQYRETRSRLYRSDTNERRKLSVD
jgi:hypothetical protein